MAGKRQKNSAGSSNSLRGDVLRVLGVLKIATADQLQRLERPHLTYRHTDKKTAAKQKEARTASHRGALNDLRKHGLALDGGHTTGAEAVRILTPAGLEAASLELGRVMEEMGGIPKGAGSTGASHAMTVNETVIALIRPKPDLVKLTGEPADAVAAAEAAVASPPGLGTIASYATEVPLPATGTWAKAGKGGAQADIVLTAPQDGVPLLFIEVDNCFETAHLLAAKFDKYMRFYQRKVKDTDGIERPMWRTRWSAPDGDYRDAPHPPVLLVFHRLGPRNPDRTIAQLEDLTRNHWQGQTTPDGGYHTYDRKIPIVATGLNMLREHGPAGTVFHRFGRPGFQTLTDAIGNPRRDTALARRRNEEAAKAAAYRAEQQHLAEEKEREREARRPVCTGCGKRFTDARWEGVRASDWGGKRDKYPKLCEDCKANAIQTKRDEAAAAKKKQKEEAAEAERKAKRPFARFRT